MLTSVHRMQAVLLGSKEGLEAVFRVLQRGVPSESRMALMVRHSQRALFYCSSESHVAQPACATFSAVEDKSQCAPGRKALRWVMAAVRVQILADACEMADVAAQTAVAAAGGVRAAAAVLQDPLVGGDLFRLARYLLQFLWHNNEANKASSGLAPCMFLIDHEPCRLIRNAGSFATSGFRLNAAAISWGGACCTFASVPRLSCRSIRVPPGQLTWCKHVVLQAEFVDAGGLDALMKQLKRVESSEGDTLAARAVCASWVVRLMPILLSISHHNDYIIRAGRRY